VPVLLIIGVVIGIIVVTINSARYQEDIYEERVDDDRINEVEQNDYRPEKHSAKDRKSVENGTVLGFAILFFTAFSVVVILSYISYITTCFSIAKTASCDTNFWRLLFSK
jgi:anaerobic C4-dicarboxylate transporter